MTKSTQIVQITRSTMVRIPEPLPAPYSILRHRNIFRFVLILRHHVQLVMWTNWTRRERLRKPLRLPELRRSTFRVRMWTECGPVVDRALVLARGLGSKRRAGVSSACVAFSGMGLFREASITSAHELTSANLKPLWDVVREFWRSQEIVQPASSFLN
jgi:hypothetical protein